MLLDNIVIAEHLTYLYQNDMFNGEYAFITLDFHYHEEWKNEKWFVSQKPFEGILLMFT